MNGVLQKVNSDTDFEVNLQKIFRKKYSWELHRIDGFNSCFNMSAYG